MNELRQDVLTGRWVVVSPHRSGRPNEFPLPGTAPDRSIACPFCPGREHLTTPEITAAGRPDGAPGNSPGWRLRCFPNKFPALEGAAQDEPATGGLFPRQSGSGRHEVIVCTPRHEATLADLTVPDLAELLGLVRDRTAALNAEAPGLFVLPFMNAGPEAGATLSHPHLQVLALPEIPESVRARQERLAAHRARTGGCLACDLVAAECADGSRVIARNGHWAAIAPWASRFPFEVGFWPRSHRSRLAAAPDADLEALAAVLKTVLEAQRRLHGDHSFNLVVVTGQEALDSLQGAAHNGFHWHLELTPRLVRLAGFETGSGFFINPVPPESAAAALRG
ncbi:MAG: galactose-1-phosphate uridylyltransferase [Candidatus Krumholzibacteriia bacterium]